MEDFDVNVKSINLFYKSYFTICILKRYNSVKSSPDFIEHMNDNNESNLSTMIKSLSVAYPSIINANYAKQFVSSSTIHQETKVAKSEAPRETAVQLVKDMFPDLGTGFGKYQMKSSLIDYKRFAQERFVSIIPITNNCLFAY